MKRNAIRPVEPQEFSEILGVTSRLRLSKCTHVSIT